MGYYFRLTARDLGSPRGRDKRYSCRLLDVKRLVNCVTRSQMQHGFCFGFLLLLFFFFFWWFFCLFLLGFFVGGFHSLPQTGMHIPWLLIHGSLIENFFLQDHQSRSVLEKKLRKY